MADYTGKVTAFNGHPLYEGRPVGQASDPLGSVSDLVFNAGYDLIDTMEGMGTMGSAVSGRAYEMLPVPGGLQSPIRQSDFQMLPEMGKAIVNNYAHSYIDPIIEGRPGDIAKHFVAHPVNTLLDIGGVGSLVKAPRLLSQAGRSAYQQSSAVKQAVDAANQIKNGVLSKAGFAADSIAESGSLGEQLVNAVDQVAPVSTAGKQAAQMRTNFAGEVLKEDSNFINEVGKAWRDVPNALKNDVQAYAEGWHPNLWNGQGVPQEVANYLGKAEKYSAVMRDRIAGLVDNADLALDKYQPAAIKFNNLTTEQWKALPREKQLAILEFTKQGMDAKGVVPQYSAHVLPGEASSVLGKPTALKGYNPAKAIEKETKLAKQVQKFSEDIRKIQEELAANPGNVELEQQLGDKALKMKELIDKKAFFLKTKQTAGEKAVKSHYDALRTRWIQIAQFQAAYKTMLKAAIEAGDELQILKNAPDAAASQMAEEAIKQLKAAGQVEMNVQELGKQVLGGLEGAVISGDELTELLKRTLPEKIYLPPEIKRALDIALKSSGARDNAIVRAYDQAVALSKRYMLGGNFTYGLAQGVQSIYMLETVAMNGVRSGITSMVSYYLAANKAVRSAVPLTIADDVIGATVNSKHYIGDALEFVFSKAIDKTPSTAQPALKGALHAYDKLVDFNLKVGAAFDGIVRAKAGIHHALMIAQENTPLGSAVREMFDTTKAADMVGKVFMDPAQEMAVAKKVNDALGNFKAISEQPGMKVIGRVTPFPSWLNFIAQYVAKLPVNHPYKSILYNNVAQLQSEFTADKQVPEYLKGGVSASARGPNGLPQVYKKEAMNPITSVGDLVQLARFVLTGQGDKLPRQQLVAPLQLGLMLMDRNNPMTGTPFKDPNLKVDKQGRQYTRSDVANLLAGRVSHIDEQRPLPDDLLMRQFMPPLSKQLETVLEKAFSDGQRSQMSGILYRSPKRNLDGGVKEAPDWMTLMIQLLVNMQPIEYDPMAKMKEQKSLKMQKRMFAKQMLKQPNQ